ncbi:PiggyBac transposable element-derived protein 4 [Plakobranchus ocellatus]|uniref:PiggyBac transposable element-derived protein 4 n=1 Tax=Plakobranchus ocellatus TaxID=259542 RepID=A0AAV4AAR4_9GAST|nr:PiggyBac transposable element-derived protein 4 [Plakobranchus ocellatus]
MHNLLDISILNSWILYNLDHHDKQIDRQRFIVAIVESLCAHDVTPNIPVAQQLADGHDVVCLEVKVERDCFVCSDRSADKRSSVGRKRTRYWCSACKVGYHLQCAQRLRHVTDQGLQKRWHIQQQE